MMNRKKFITQATLATGSLLTAPALSKAAEWFNDTERLTILHTNDTHSRLDQFPSDGSTYAGKGGAAARSFIITKIRQQQEHVLLFDAGDIFQGTPYFTIFEGEPEIKAMS